MTLIELSCAIRVGRHSPRRLREYANGLETHADTPEDTEDGSPRTRARCDPTRDGTYVRVLYDPLRLEAMAYCHCTLHGRLSVGRTTARPCEE
jgi:hypothetical protein